ncbi:hypothetical protein AYI69_g1436 [Smittium culicis]|uniref:Uncharacterized protein n=1 Tax=Smittium culicis TaxID=133412 RepID=A0A1R1YQ95_9FUNG|nr:hypothetical protein AYI69_g1436 [Smittium culicis]
MTSNNKNDKKIGNLEVEDNLLLELIEKASKTTIFFYALSRSLFNQKIKNNSVPKYLKYSLFCYFSKNLENHVVFKDHLYMCGSIYASKALEIMNSITENFTTDYLISLLILSTHYMGLGQHVFATNLLGISFLNIQF